MSLCKLSPVRVFLVMLTALDKRPCFVIQESIVADSQSNLSVWDSQNARIRKIAPNATVTTFAGGGNQSTGVGTNVNLAPLNIEGGITKMTIDRNDTIWVVNGISTFLNGRSGLFGSSLLCKITSDGVVTMTNLFPVTFTYNHAFAGVCSDSLGNIYISDAIANVIYRYTTNGLLSVFVGSGNSGYADGTGLFTAFNKPAVLITDLADNIYVWDSGNLLIRRINSGQSVTTFAGKYGNISNADGVGTNATFISVNHMCVDNYGNLLLACGNCVRKISATTNVVTLAGSFSQNSYTNGAGNLARFSGASGVCVSGDKIYVADSSNQRIRSITNNPTAEPVLPANLQLNTYSGLQIVGTVGRTYQVQSSPDMTNWTTRTTLFLNSSPYLWIDQNPVSGNKFYRALLLP